MGGHAAQQGVDLICIVSSYQPGNLNKQPWKHEAFSSALEQLRWNASMQRWD